MESGCSTCPVGMNHSLCLLLDASRFRAAKYCGLHITLALAVLGAPVGKLQGGVIASSLQASAGKDEGAPALPAQFLRTSANGRYLLDGAGAPLFVLSDTAWTLPSAYSEQEVAEYLDKRLKDGFNAIQMCALFGNPKDENAHVSAFEAGDISRPQESYWKHVDWVVEETTRRGLNVIISPIWKRHFNVLLKDNGPDKCRGFGRWFAGRYRSNPRVLYFIGGDQRPEPVREELNAIGEGIQEVYDGTALVAFHSEADQSSHEAYPTAAWLTLNWTYAYAPPYRKKFPYEENWENWERTPARPIQFGEGFYDFGAETKAGQNHQRARWADRFALRRQAWWAGPLTGAAGVAYGSEAIWMHNRGTETWRNAVQDESGHDVRRMATFFEGLGWWSLEPDTKQTFLVGGFGRWQTDDFAVAAVSTDRATAVVYTPVNRTLELQTNQLHDGKLSAYWFDPASGDLRLAEIPGLAQRGKITVKSPDRNSAGQEDFVLLLRVR